MLHPSEPASVLLGSGLLVAANAREKLIPIPASSGSAIIDEKTLEGGFRYGDITSIAGPSGTAKTLITYHAVASHILANEAGEVAIIDTAGSFSPLRLRDVLVFRLEAQSQRRNFQQSGYMHEKTPSAPGHRDEEAVDKANLMLDRVKVMRVFDFAGMVEAVGEIKEMREMPLLESHEVETPVEDSDERRNEVVDSENETSDGDTHESPSKPAPNPTRVADGKVGMVIIDTISNVTSSVVQKSQTQGQALLASFMRFLHHLTASHHICTILVNAAVGMNASNNREFQRRPEEHVSMFSSTLGKPALGKTFAHLIDTSVYLSAIPKTSEDAAVSFANQFELSSSQNACVVEVLKDRYGTREGRWAAVEVVADVKLVPFLD